MGASEARQGVTKLPMSIDPKWLEILKASGWQTSLLAIGCAIFLALARWDIIPTDALPIAIPAMWLGLIISGSLALATILQSGVEALPVHKWVQGWLRDRSAQRAVADYIPFMTTKDRQIIGHLLHHRNKTFLCASDGGHASTLIARGIVILAARPGQVVDLEDVPFTVPDHIWEVLERHRDEFPHKPTMNGAVEVQPWRVGWMER